MVAATNTKQRQQQSPPAGGKPVVLEPMFEWAEKAGGYVLRITLQGFKKDDFRVQVDGAGRLTVSGARPGTTPGSLHKVFELPSTASLDDISGRFEAGVLTLTVPKRAYSGVPAPTSIEEIKRDKLGVAKEEGASSTTAVTPPASKDVASGEKKTDSGDESMKPKTKPKEEIGKQEHVSNKVMDEATMKAQQQKQPEEASKQKEEQQKLAPEPEAKKEEEVKPKAAQEAPEKPAPEPEVAMGEKAKSVVEQQSLASVVRRRSEEEKVKAVAAAMEAKAVLEKKATACSGWKERVAGGLEQLTDMKWADNVVEKAGNNKEVVAIAIAAFSLGFFVSQKLFRK